MLPFHRLHVSIAMALGMADRWGAVLHLHGTGLGGATWVDPPPVLAARIAGRRAVHPPQAPRRKRLAWGGLQACILTRWLHLPPPGLRPPRLPATGRRALCVPCRAHLINASPGCRRRRAVGRSSSKYPWTEPPAQAADWHYTAPGVAVGAQSMRQCRGRTRRRFARVLHGVLPAARPCVLSAHAHCGRRYVLYGWPSATS